MCSSSSVFEHLEFCLMHESQSREAFWNFFWNNCVAVSSPRPKERSRIGSWMTTRAKPSLQVLPAKYFQITTWQHKIFRNKFLQKVITNCTQERLDTDKFHGLRLPRHMAGFAVQGLA
ncbi:uncharacterized protein LOC144381391 isoform X2 [Halichoerus grypus]